jgi:hemoglobin
MDVVRVTGRREHRLMTATLYQALGGAPVLLRLAEAWHRRCLADPVVSHAFSHGLHERHSDRLAAYWAESLGGPAEFTSRIGSHEDVLRLHAGNGEHPEMDQRAIACFTAALDDALVPDDPAVRRSLTAWFTAATIALAAHPRSPEDVESGAPFPHWSWDGPSH